MPTHNGREIIYTGAEAAKLMEMGLIEEDLDSLESESSGDISSDDGEPETTDPVGVDQLVVPDADDEVVLEDEEDEEDELVLEDWEFEKHDDFLSALPTTPITPVAVSREPGSFYKETVGPQMCSELEEMSCWTPMPNYNKSAGLTPALDNVSLTTPVIKRRRISKLAPKAATPNVIKFSKAIDYAKIAEVNKKRNFKSTPMEICDEILLEHGISTSEYFGDNHKLKDKVRLDIRHALTAIKKDKHKIIDMTEVAVRLFERGVEKKSVPAVKTYSNLTRSGKTYREQKICDEVTQFIDGILKKPENVGLPKDKVIKMLGQYTEVKEDKKDNCKVSVDEYLAYSVQNGSSYRGNTRLRKFLGKRTGTKIPSNYKLKQLKNRLLAPVELEIPDKVDGDDMIVASTTYRASMTKTVEQFYRYPVKQEPFTHRLPNDQVLHVIPRIHRTMLDGKARKIYAGNGGAWCIECDMTPEQMHTLKTAEKPVVIKYGSVDDLMKECRKHTIDGKVDRDIDSSVRKGFTNLPLGRAEMGVVLHATLNTARTVYEHIAKAECFDVNQIAWNTTFTKAGKARINEAKKAFGRKVFAAHKIHILEVGYSNSGDGVVGNSAKEVLSRAEDVCSLMTNKDAAKFLKEVMDRLWVIVATLGSNDTDIDAKRYELFCRVTYRKILRNMPWFRMSPTLHQILHHSWEWIHFNNGQGLLRWAEDGLESSQKRTRNIRKSVYQGSTRLNMIQTHEQLQLESDLYLASLRTWDPPPAKNKHRLAPGLNSEFRNC